MTRKISISEEQRSSVLTGSRTPFDYWKRFSSDQMRTIVWLITLVKYQKQEDRNSVIKHFSLLFLLSLTTTAKRNFFAEYDVSPISQRPIVKVLMDARDEMGSPSLSSALFTSPVSSPCLPRTRLHGSRSPRPRVCYPRRLKVCDDDSSPIDSTEYWV